jgi:putative ABC transport system permease protein
MEALRGDPRVTRVDSLLLFGGLLIRERENVAMQGRGISPDTPYFEDVREHIVEGEFLREETQILVSRSTAELLSLEVGGPAVVLTEDSTGSPFYMEYTVSGLYDTDSQELDESTFFITRSAAQELLYVGEGVTQIRANLSDRALAEAVAEDHREVAAEEGGEIRTWREIHGSFTVLLEFFDIFMIFMNLLVVVVAATVITNAILMNVFEKAGEYGTMRAIGMKRKQHFLLVLAEGSVQGALGSLAGVLLGVPLTLYFQFNGIYVGAASDAFGLGRTVYTLVRPDDVLLSLIAGVLVAVGGSLYAAVVNVRSSVVELVTSA